MNRSDVSPQNENVRFVQSKNVRFHGGPRATWSAIEPQVRYEQGGCMVCARSDTPHSGLGMCTRCYSREFQLRTRILRKLIEESDAGHQI
jgi:hypothetical protein